MSISINKPDDLGYRHAGGIKYSASIFSGFSQGHLMFEQVLSTKIFEHVDEIKKTLEEKLGKAPWPFQYLEMSLENEELSMVIDESRQSTNAPSDRRKDTRERLAEIDMLFKYFLPKIF